MECVLFVSCDAIGDNNQVDACMISMFLMPTFPKVTAGSITEHHTWKISPMCMMIAYCCGFNGFNQISEENSGMTVTSLKRLPFDDVQDLDFSWSCAVVLSGGDAYVSGFFGEQTSFFRKLTKPIGGLELLKVACNETFALFATEEGDCWQYFYNTETWKKLLDFTAVEDDTAVTENDCLSSLHKNINTVLEDNTKNFKRKITKVDCEEGLNIALDDSGRVYSIPSSIPMQGIKVTEVACGFEHCIMLDEFERVYTWGSGMRGQLGCEALETADAPREVRALGGLRVARVAAGGWHCAALTAAGGLYTWGWNGAGQLGFPAAAPAAAAAAPAAADDDDDGCSSRRARGQEETVRDLHTEDIAESNISEERTGNTSCGREAKKMKFSSLREHGELGTTKSPECEEESETKKLLYEKTDDPKEIGDASAHVDRASLSSGGDESCDQKDIVTVLPVPRLVDFPSDTDVDVVDVGCGNRHTVALAGDGTLWGCGWNAYAQLGMSPDLLASTDCMTKLDISPKGCMNIRSVFCGSWNTAIFTDK